MIGPQTGQVINYAVRSKDCRVCTTAASKNQQVREQACSKNWDGSSKAMEADMVIEMVREVQEKGHDIDAIIGDEDSTTIGRLRANVNDNIVKVSDKNHIRKLFGNSLYGIKKQHPMLTVKASTCRDVLITLWHKGKGFLHRFLLILKHFHDIHLETTSVVLHDGVDSLTILAAFTNHFHLVNLFQTQISNHL